MARAELKKVAKKSAIQILTELASGFSSVEDYMRYLEGLAIMSFTHALCAIDEQQLGVSEANRADGAYGRSAAFLLNQELEIQRRLNQAVCGREIVHGPEI